MNHPWRELYEHLRGKGVSSLSDAMRDLQLTPVHQALRAILEPSVIEQVFEDPRRAESADKKAGKLETAGVAVKKAAKETSRQPAEVRGDGHQAAPLITRDDSVHVLALRVQTLLERARDLASGESAVTLGVPASSQWRGDIEKAIASFQSRVEATRRVPFLERQFGTSWSAHACAVLPNEAGKENAARWATVIAWATVYALGELLDPSEPDAAATKLFDSLQLRNALADAFSQFGMEGEERWRAAARVRAVLANERWLPGAKRSTKSPYSWLHDPDVSWLINVHEYEGVRYFNKEMYECLLWWMALPALARIAESPTSEPKSLRELELQIKSRINAAEAAGYQVMALFELGESGAEEAPSSVSSDESPVEEESHPRSR